VSNSVHIELLPLGKTLTVERGTLLQDVLFAQGVEFPCGGRGRCKGCKIKLLEGFLPVTGEEEQKLTRAEIAGGWRLACRGQATGDLKIELAQWEAAILADESVFAFRPQEGWGVAVDLGTTTIVAQLLDLRTGHVLAVQTALNSQAQHGADIMSRIEFAFAGGLKELVRLIREQIGSMITELIASTGGGGDLKNVVVVGNTVMHHLFCGISVEPLSHYPFETENDGLHIFPAADLGWHFSSNPPVRFLPCLGGFVGSDLLAGILATKLHEAEAPVALIDLGTNGEIVIGNREKILCASTAAGPAFEGARISMGMRAATGAISEVHVEQGRLRFHVLGNVPPRGICGSGLVDVVASGLDLGLVLPAGKLAANREWMLEAPVSLTQWDIRELQLAKGAIAAGVRILVRHWGTRMEDIARVYLAGAFGNYIRRSSARRIGLIDFPAEKIQAAGNTALLGAKLALFSLDEQDGSYSELRKKIRHISLNEDPGFHEIYVEQMQFPASANS
jgi:uncharacterized 2Fe-2S/4Fe-4S cluster protein (DUF4445 family)